MEKIIEVTEEIEKKGVEILKEADKKVEEIMELTEEKIKSLKEDEFLKANQKITELNRDFQAYLEKETKKLIMDKDAKVQSILKQDISKINIKELMDKDILEIN